MTISFSYEKPKVIQALRYHFISRPEIKFMIILVNVFALTSAALFYFHKITPMAFLVGSLLWFFLMISFWFVMPSLVYRRAATFRDHFTMWFEEGGFTLGNERGSRTWPWKALSTFLESPHFFHLYFDSRSFILVPKSGCRDQAEVADLRRILRDKTGKG
ncbi:MAG TPA: YcxB family protein [Chitinophagaceae bacterium]|nr:YcxB family protein [Chitinophagaceae bacterium]